MHPTLSLDTNASMVAAVSMAAKVGVVSVVLVEDTWSPGSLCRLFDLEDLITLPP